jgi:hypothetical protein
MAEGREEAMSEDFDRAEDVEDDEENGESEEEDEEEHGYEDEAVAEMRKGVKVLEQIAALMLEIETHMKAIRSATEATAGGPGFVKEQEQQRAKLTAMPKKKAKKKSR